MKLKVMLISSLLVGVIAPASAQMAVFDPANFTQNLQQVYHMVSELQKLQQQIQTAQDQLQQAKQQVSAMTGSRGMGRLVTDSDRNYIPRNWQETLAGRSGRLSELTDSIKRTAGYLEDRDLAKINGAYRDMLKRRGDEAANGAAANAAVFEEAGARFERLQRLMDQVDLATDQKAISDLSARIAAEQAMLQNEAIKAQAMNATIQQRQAVERERQRQEMMSESIDY